SSFSPSKPPKPKIRTSQDLELTKSEVEQMNRFREIHIRDPGPGAPEEKVNEELVRYVRSIIEPDPAWSRFFSLKGVPPRVDAVLEQYRFVQSKIDELHEKAPFRSPDQRVDRVSFCHCCRDRLVLMLSYSPMC